MNADTLLIIEDSPELGSIIAKLFAAFTEFKLLVAHGLEDVRHLSEAYKGDIFAAVVNWNLPDAPNGDAVDMCRDNNIPCIVLAASVDEKLRQRFIKKRVADYFCKGSITDLRPLITSVTRLQANYKVKALVVDDSDRQRNIVRRMLADQCIQSLEAVDGVAALEALEANREIRLVITDFQMPRMDGIELVQAIRHKYTMDRLAVIGISSTGSGALTARFLKNGANDFLTKPFEAEECYWRVNQTLNLLDIRASRNWKNGLRTFSAGALQRRGKKA